MWSRWLRVRVPSVTQRKTPLRRGFLFQGFSLAANFLPNFLPASRLILVGDVQIEISCKLDRDKPGVLPLPRHQIGSEVVDINHSRGWGFANQVQPLHFPVLITRRQGAKRCACPSGPTTKEKSTLRGAPSCANSQGRLGSASVTHSRSVCLRNFLGARTRRVWDGISARLAGVIRGFFPWCFLSLVVVFLSGRGPLLFHHDLLSVGFRPYSD